MARQARPLVREYLENASAKLYVEHSELITEFLRGQHGIYALYRRDKLYYVGLASSMRVRLKQHLRDKHAGKWDRFSVYLVNDVSHIRELEALVIRISAPRGNSQKGRLRLAKNLRNEVGKRIQQKQKRQFDELLGRKRPSPSARSRRGVPRGGTSGDEETALAREGVRSCRLRATINGETVYAKVMANGWIRYDGYLYRSPSGAGKAVCGRNCSGWSFWQIRRDGEWVPLASIRKSKRRRTSTG